VIIGLFTPQHDTEPYISRPSTTKSREVNHLWEVFLQRKLTLVS